MKISIFKPNKLLTIIPENEICWRPQFERKSEVDKSKTSDKREAK